MVPASDRGQDGPLPGGVLATDPSAIDRFVGERMRVLRLGLGLAPRDFAERIGVTRHLLQRYEAGRRPVPAATLVRAAVVCDCLPDSFFPGGGESTGYLRRFADEAETRELTGLFESCPPQVRRRILAFARAVALA